MRHGPGPTFLVSRLDWTVGLGGYYADDLQAIQEGAEPDGLVYQGASRTRGHRRVRDPSLAVLVRVADSEGHHGWGDVVAPQYSGFGGRDLPIDPPALSGQLAIVRDALTNAGVLTYSTACVLVESLRTSSGSGLHAGVRYGVSQALLALSATVSGETQLCVLCHITQVAAPQAVPIYAQSGEERRRNVDKMILKRVDVLPHGLLNSPSLFGQRGELFLDYARWVRDRVLKLRDDEAYRPLLHFDVYGVMGLVTRGSPSAMADLCAQLEETCRPFSVQLESAVYGATSAETIERVGALHRILETRGISVSLVADDFCNDLDDVRAFVQQGVVDMIQLKMPDMGTLTNTIEAARICRLGGVGVFVGGSCTETEVSARMSANVAMAVDADQVLAKPGMGVDEGVLIVGNEMARSLLEWDLARVVQ
jgi:methylaspartate ammonia-lyase